MPLSELSSPPRPPLAFRVGIVGHRPERLASADLPKLGSVLSGILGVVREDVLSFGQQQPYLFSPQPSMLRAISPLAEGVDRIFAEQALELGYDLCCPLPFPREEFEKDFLPDVAMEPDSLNRFRNLISRASTVFELDGDRQGHGREYGACGHVVVNQSDLLIIVWD